MIDLLVSVASSASDSILRGFSPILRWWPGAGSCQLHELTGLWCPLCGGTRATLALLHGDPIAAVGWNPLAPVIEAVMLVVVVRFALTRVRNRHRAFLSTREGIALGAVIMVFFVARNTPWLQPWLARLLGPPGLGV